MGQGVWSQRVGQLALPRTVDKVRILTALEDFQELADIHQESQAALPASPQEIDNASAPEFFATQRRLLALHKAAIEFSVIAINVALHELVGQPCSVMTFLRKPVARSQDADLWTRIYLLNVWRNKLIGHRDHRTRDAAIINSAGDRYLVAFMNGLISIPPEMVPELDELASSVSWSDEAMPANYYERAERLFHLIPVTRGGRQSKSRLAIDSLVERGCAVKSYSVGDVERILQDFIAALPETV
jgi:hypothetical protein